MLNELRRLIVEWIIGKAMLNYPIENSNDLNFINDLKKAFENLIVYKSKSK